MTNTELITMVKECQATLDTVWGRPIVSPKITNVSFNPRLKRALGRAIYNSLTGGFRIEFSTAYFNSPHITMESKKGVVYHELIHTVDGCFNHGGKFNAIAVTIEHMEGISGISGTHTATPDKYRASVKKYKITCMNDGCNTIGYRDRTLISGRQEGQVLNYRCSSCKGTLYQTVNK
jgi:predicted SprT family Zn-dependent metalloprotease